MRSTASGSALTGYNGGVFRIREPTEREVNGKSILEKVCLKGGWNYGDSDGAADGYQ